MGPNLVRIVEWQLALLRAAGLPDRVAAYSGDLLALYVGAFAFEQSVGVDLGDDDGADDAVRGELGSTDFLAMMREYLTSLPAERFPNIRSMVDELLAGDADERFEFGLQVLIAGLAAQTAR